MRALLQNVAILLIATVATLLLVELACRVFMPEWAPARAERVAFWRYDSLLGWAHTPNQIDRFDHRDFSVQVSINSQGLRDGEYARQPAPGRHRMLVLGDSFGWGFGVQQNEIFSEVLEARHSEWDIINASVSGYGTDQEYLYFKHSGVAYEPGIVLLLFHQSDFVDVISSQRYLYDKPVFRLNSDGDLLLRNSPVRHASIEEAIQRYILARTWFLSRLYYALKSSRQEGAPQPVSSNHSNSDASLKGSIIVARLLGLLNRLAKEHGARLVVVSVPMSEPYRQELAETLGAEGVPYLALDAAFANPQAAVTFAHDGHWNAAGHRIAADAIEEFLQLLGIFQPVGG